METDRDASRICGLLFRLIPWGRKDTTGSIVAILAGDSKLRKVAPHLKGGSELAILAAPSCYNPTVIRFSVVWSTVNRKGRWRDETSGGHNGQRG